MRAAATNWTSCESPLRCVRSLPIPRIGEDQAISSTAMSPEETLRDVRAWNTRNAAEGCIRTAHGFVVFLGH